jgi:hypothetical protein
MPLPQFSPSTFNNRQKFSVIFAMANRHGENGIWRKLFDIVAEANI